MVWEPGSFQLLLVPWVPTLQGTAAVLNWKQKLSLSDVWESGSVRTQNSAICLHFYFCRIVAQEKNCFK